ncbi:R-spondin-2-like [Poeciliopsis prolifica]|uniref:R-spondin-2-like n=1 Tax=Poeciliopsis prolifica TaxID=188132 RepID=UPI00241404DD|nr:R-spondin-2-like [Poeciliopsis prolifica]
MHLRLFAFGMTLLCEVIRMGSGVTQKRSAESDWVESVSGNLSPDSSASIWRFTVRRQQEASSFHDFHGAQSQDADLLHLEDLWSLPSPPAFLSCPRLIFVLIFPRIIRICLNVLPAAHRETSEDCQSCLECSRDNGCVRCPERLFLFLQRKGMSHHGTCLHSCPTGHFGQRGRDVNRCMKCRSLDCELCFSRDFCTKCKPGFKLHKGKCLIHCPEGTFAHQTDCLEVCPLPPLGEWSEWSVCVRDGATCGFRWGKQTRVRESSQSGKATEKASVCPPQRETQRCRMKKNVP